MDTIEAAEQLKFTLIDPHGHDKHHGRDKYYMVDENIILTLKGPVSPEAAIERYFAPFARVFESSEGLTGEEAPFFRFGRMFDEQCDQPDDPVLTILGQKMTEQEKSRQSKTPAGYTFLGQFISHDMSFDDQRLIFAGDGFKPNFLSRESPSLDLDGLYGAVYSETGEVTYNPDLYETNSPLFKIGRTVKAGVNSIPNDFDRKDAQIKLGIYSRTIRKANIGDARNDENLGLSQTTVAFLRFHNAVVKRLMETGFSKNLFETARQLVIRHYQWIVLKDFLPRMIDPTILKEVIERVISGDDPCADWLRDQQKTFMPVEFAAAAFRLGHAIIKEKYEWNRFFNSSAPKAATIEDLFKFTALGGIEGKDFIPSNWIIDWRRFYDFSFYNIEQPKTSNLSNIIEPALVNVLSNLDEFFPQDAPIPNLAVRNLLRGQKLRLPSGQEVRKKLGTERLGNRPALSPQELAEGPMGKCLVDNGLVENTPLWYYILKEAEVHGDAGNRLGPVGSYIVADTVVRLVARGAISILREEWSPQLSDPVIIAPLGAPNGFGMADLIKFAHTKDEPLIHPG